LENHFIEILDNGNIGGVVIKDSLIKLNELNVKVGSKEEILSKVFPYSFKNKVKISNNVYKVTINVYKSFSDKNLFNNLYFFIENRIVRKIIFSFDQIDYQ